MAKTSTIDGIPVFEALLSDEECGMIRISLVDDPAVMSGWQKFKKAPQMYAVQNEEQRLVRGVVMRADFPIYRIDNKGGEYYIIYRADTIREMAEKYLAESRQNNVDTMHDGNEVDGVEMVQFFIKDTSKGINPEGFDDIADGSLFAEFHVTNDEVWAAIKDGTYQGFSLEGVFGFATEPDQQDIDEIVDGLAGEFSAANKDTKKTIMAKIERILELLRTRLEAEERAEKFGRVTTDKGIIEWPGDEDLKEGDSVEVVTEDDTREAAADGDYKTEDGKTIVVVDGKVAEIRDPEAEVAPEPNEEQKARRAEHLSRKQKFEESYDEKIRRISEAVNAGLSPGEYAYIVSAGDDFAVAAVWNDEDYTDKYYRYAVTWNEDGSANVGEGVECRQAFVPMDFDDSAAFGAKVESEEENLRAANATLEAEVESLRAQVTELKAQPAAKPAHEEVKEQSFRKTGAKGLDRVAELMSK